MILSIALSCLACTPLRDEGGCSKPCPLACPNACFPTGYCRTETAHVDSRFTSQFLSLPFGDLPPGVTISITFHLVEDLGDRGDTVPWDYWIQVQRAVTPMSNIIDVSAFNTDDFPVVADWTSIDEADSNGNLNFDLIFSCYGRGGRSSGGGCTTLPGTTATVTVLDTRPWEDPPACP